MTQQELNNLFILAITRLYGNVAIHTPKDREILEQLYTITRNMEGGLKDRQ